MAVVVLTGAARGLGLELTRAMASDPSISRIFATSRGESPSSGLASIISANKDKVHYVSLEVTNSKSIASAVERIQGHLNGSGVNILINNAGMLALEMGGATAMDQLETTLTTNVVSVSKVTSAFVPLMREATGQKKIVNITSTLGSIGLVDVFAGKPCASYKVSKAALNMLTAQFAIDLGKEGFTSFVISPGWLKTDLGGGDMADLEPEVGAKAVLEIIVNATEKDNGAFRDIYVPGYELYSGANPPW